MPEFKFTALFLSGVCVIVFILAQIFPISYSYFTLVSSLVLERPWTIITSIFMHANAVHLVSNLFALSLFGSILEKYVGWKKFIIIFFSTGIISSVGDLLWYNETLGASGAIFGVMGALATLRPKQIVWALGVPMYIIVAAFVWVFLDLIGLFYPDNIAHVAHLFGLAFGMGIGVWMRKFYPPPKKKKHKEVEISEESLRRFENKYMRYD